MFRSGRKTISISIAKDLSVVVKAPLGTPEEKISELLLKYAGWIEKHRLLREKQNERRTFSEAEKASLKEKAAEAIREKIVFFSRLTRLFPVCVKITMAESRRGSCSGKNSLCVSYKTALLPAELLDYVVLHEIIHIKVKNHGRMFYREIEKFMPDYKDRISQIRMFQKNQGI